MERAPKQYSVYQKVDHEWVGTHRLPISAALRHFYEARNRGYRVLLRLDGEPGPRYAD